MNKFLLDINIQHIFGIPYSPHHLLALEQFSKTVQESIANKGKPER